jgi:hypothetical protein
MHMLLSLYTLHVMLLLHMLLLLYTLHMLLSLSTSRTLHMHMHMLPSLHMKACRHAQLFGLGRTCDAIFDHFAWS